MVKRRPLVRFFSLVFCCYRRHNHHGLSELQSMRFTLIVLTSNVGGLFDLVNMNHIQLDYTIVPTPTPRLLESRLSKKKERKRVKRERERERNKKKRETETYTYLRF